MAPDSGKIEITAGNSGDEIQVTVADNGPGIPDSIRESLFQPFVSYGKEKGVGLGLTVVHKIMQNHGGEVSIERTGPEGTVFKLVFPAGIPEESLAKT